MKPTLLNPPVYSTTITQGFVTAVGLQAILTCLTTICKSNFSTTILDGLPDYFILCQMLSCETVDAERDVLSSAITVGTALSIQSEVKLGI